MCNPSRHFNCYFYHFLLKLSYICFWLFNTRSMSFNFSELAFLGVPQKTITLDNIRAVVEGDDTRRIAFASSHAGALKKTDGNHGKIVLPFNDTIGAFIHAEIGRDVNLFSSKFRGFWRAINSEEEFERFEAFIEKYRDVVFLRDNLDLSIALSMNFEDDEEHTEIGDLEYRAKFQNDAVAEAELSKRCAEWIERLPYYKHARYICAVPGERGVKNLPARIVSTLDAFGFDDISQHVYWQNKTRKIKNAESVDEKLEILDDSCLAIDNDIDLKGSSVILFDDLYMSGLTMQYLAMKLKERGASRVLGLSIVKSRKNK